nr:proteoglycan 4-like [Paramormyrops kingsleyae]
MSELSTDRRFHNLTKEQIQTLDQVLTEVIPIHGRGNFPTLEVKPKDIIHVVRDKLKEKHIKVRDVRLNGSTASHVLVKENGTSYKDLDIIFGVELPRQEDFQIIKEVVLGCLLDFLPRGVNKDKITALTMKEAYVQKMVKVFNEHDRWSLISLSNNSGKNVELKFVSSLRRQFEFSVDSFQIILDRMLESYLEAERRQEARCKNEERRPCTTESGNQVTSLAEESHPTSSDMTQSSQVQPDKVEDIPSCDDSQCNEKQEVTQDGEWPLPMEGAAAEVMDPPEQMEVIEPDGETPTENEQELLEKTEIEDKIMAENEVGTPSTETKGQYPKTSEEMFITENEAEPENSEKPQPTEKTSIKDPVALNVPCEPTFQSCTCLTQTALDSYMEFPLPPPAKKSYKKSQMVILKHSSPKPPRKMSKKVTSVPIPLAQTPSENEPPFLLEQPLASAKINLKESIPIPDKVPNPVCSQAPDITSQGKECSEKKSDMPTTADKLTTQESDTESQKKTTCSQPNESKTSDHELFPPGAESEVTELDKKDKDLLIQNPFKDEPSPSCHLPEPPVRVPYSTCSVVDSAVQVSEVIVQVPEHPVQVLDFAVQVPEPGIQELQQAVLGTELEALEMQSSTEGTKHADPLVDLTPQVAVFASQVTCPAALMSEPICKLPEPAFQEQQFAPDTDTQVGDKPESQPTESSPLRELPDITVVAESMYGDFEQAMDHLRYRLIATRNPEEIRGGGLLKYSNLLVREFKPASETEIKTLERYMCSRFFIDFPDVNEQQRKIESYLRNHFIGEEKSKYDYLMTLRRVVNESTVCLMGHERRQTLNMITILALKVLGEQNIIPNTTNVTCYYQPAPYMADHNFSNYYIAHGQPPLIYHPYPMHMHIETGLV